MSLIVGLPSDLQSSILRDWLSKSAEIGKLDAAFCNKKLRPEFLRTLEISYIIPSISTDEENIIAWLTARNIKADAVILKSNTFEREDFLAKFFGGPASAPTTISIERSIEKQRDQRFIIDGNPKMFIIRDIVPHLLLPCVSKLRELHIMHGCLPYLFDQVIAAAPELRIINFERTRNMDALILHACCSCPHLETLILTDCVFYACSRLNEQFSPPQCPTLHTVHAANCSMDLEVAYDLFCSFENLTTLSYSLKSMNLRLDILAECTRNLRKLSMTNLMHDIDVTMAASMCEEWHQLQYLELHMYHKDNKVSCTEDALVVFVTQLPTLRYLSVVRSKFDAELISPVYPRTPCTPLPLLLPPITTNTTTPTTTTTTTNTTTIRKTKKTTVAADGKTIIVAVKSSLLELQIGSISTPTLELILNTCPDLHTLHFTFPIDSTQPLLATQLPLLHTINTLILENAEISDIHLHAMRNLECIHLYSVGGDLTKTGFSTMAKQSPNLRCFTLSSGPAYANEEVMYAVLNECPKIEHLAMFSYEMDKRNRKLEGRVKLIFPHIGSVELRVYSDDYVSDDSGDSSDGEQGSAENSDDGYIVDGPTNFGVNGTHVYVDSYGGIGDGCDIDGGGDFESDDEYDTDW